MGHVHLMGRKRRGLTNVGRRCHLGCTHLSHLLTCGVEEGSLEEWFLPFLLVLSPEHHEVGIRGVQRANPGDSHQS